MRTMHLFAGAGGGLLADLILGHTPIAAIEIDPGCCNSLRARKADGWFRQDIEIIECDIRTFDPTPYAGRVDCLCAGFPCQDISQLGSGEGLDGERSGLFSEVIRVLRSIRCRWCYLENVPGITISGLDRVGATLSEMGYDSRWCCLSSGNTGASMLGDRWWLLAEAVRVGLEGKLRGGQRNGQMSEAVAEAYEDGRYGFSEEGVRVRGNSFWRDSDGCLRDPPWREDREGWERAQKDGAPEPGIYRVVDAMAWGVVKQRIAAIGNGQDPILAAAAFTILMGNSNEAKEA